MTASILTLSYPVSLIDPSSFFSNFQDKVAEVFWKIKENFVPQAQEDLADRQVINFGALHDKPGEIIEGAFWAGFWCLSAYFAADSFYELYRVFTVEHAAQEKFEKIGSAVKTAFVDLLSLCSSTTYIARWADTAEVISLGQYLPLVKNLCFGLSLAINGVESGADIYNIWQEKEAILNETAPAEKEMHKKWLCHSLVKLIGNVNMVAWAALGIASLAGLAVSPILLTTLLSVGCVLGMAAHCYKKYIEMLSKTTATRTA